MLTAYTIENLLKEKGFESGILKLVVTRLYGKELQEEHTMVVKDRMIYAQDERGQMRYDTLTSRWIEKVWIPLCNRVTNGEGRYLQNSLLYLPEKGGSYAFSIRWNGSAEPMDPHVLPLWMCPKCHSLYNSWGSCDSVCNPAAAVKQEVSADALIRAFLQESPTAIATVEISYRDGVTDSFQPASFQEGILTYRAGGEVLVLSDPVYKRPEVCLKNWIPQLIRIHAIVPRTIASMRLLLTSEKKQSVFPIAFQEVLEPSIAPRFTQ